MLLLVSLLAALYTPASSLLWKTNGNVDCDQDTYQDNNYPNATINCVLGTLTQDPLHFVTGENIHAGVKMSILPHKDIKVGIGTGLPDNNYMLDVAGKMRSCEVRVNNPGWCDYVFAPDYRLMPLSQLADYLKTHRHLPEMPAEAEVVSEGGFDLAAMNVALLKRAEENTLYILQLEERLLAAETANELHQKQLAELMTTLQMLEQRLPVLPTGIKP